MQKERVAIEVPTKAQTCLGLMRRIRDLHGDPLTSCVVLRVLPEGRRSPGDLRVFFYPQDSLETLEKRAQEAVKELNKSKVRRSRRRIIIKTQSLVVSDENLRHVLEAVLACFKGDPMPTDIWVRIIGSGNPGYQVTRGGVSSPSLKRYLERLAGEGESFNSRPRTEILRVDAVS